MDTASAAAAASTPTIKGGVTLDSFDARIVEYHAAIRKLESLTTQVKAVNIKVRSQEGTIPLVHYIVALSGPWVAGASDVLKKRLNQVACLEMVTDSRKMNPPVSTMAISFEVDEQQELRAPDYASSDVDYGLLLQNLLSIFESTLSIYQAKLKQCVLERDAHRRPDANHKPIPLDFNSFKDILEPTEIMNLSKLVSSKPELASAPFKTTPFLLDSINTTINNINKYHAELLNYRKKTSEGILKRLPAWQNTNHRIFACFVKLAELYNILRKVGRDLYLPVTHDLHNPKILHNNVKLEVALNNCDEFLKSSKRNEQIMFTLTRATRQGSYLHLKRDVILSFISPLEQSILLNKKLVEVILDLLKNWELVEAKEKRTKLRLDTQVIKERTQATTALSPQSENKRLSVLFNPEREKQSQEAIAKQQRERERVILEERSERERAEKERQTVEDIKSKRRIEARERELRDELTKDRSPSVSRTSSLLRTRQRSDSNASTSSASKFGPPPVITTRQRSGSNASTTSNSSNSSVLNSMRNNSLTNAPVQRSPTALSRSPSIQTRRPASVYMSSPAFDIRSEIRRQEKAKAAAAASAASLSPPSSGLKRTPSLPTGHPVRPNSQLAATAGAASALKQGRQEPQARSSSLKTQAELRQHRQMLSTTAPQNHLRAGNTRSNGSRSSRSPSPLRPLPNQHQPLPDISELSIQPSTVRTPPRPTNSRLSTPEITRTLVNDLTMTPTPSTIIEEDRTDYIHSDAQYTPSKSPSPVLKSSLKPASKTLDPGSASPCPAPELTHTTETTSTESSISFEPHFDEEESSDGKTLTTVQETSEPITPIKPIKKVRFTGVPDMTEDPKPKKKGWIHPPKILLRNNNKPQTSLSFAAQALVQQERVTFSNIKRGQFDMKTGKVIYPDQKSTRIMNTLGNGGSTPSPKGKWSIGGRLKDRFA